MIFTHLLGLIGLASSAPIASERKSIMDLTDDLKFNKTMNHTVLYRKETSRPAGREEACSDPSQCVGIQLPEIKVPKEDFENPLDEICTKVFEAIEAGSHYEGDKNQIEACHTLGWSDISASAPKTNQTDDEAGNPILELCNKVYEAIKAGSTYIGDHNQLQACHLLGWENPSDTKPEQPGPVIIHGPSNEPPQVLSVPTKPHDEEEPTEIVDLLFPTTEEACRELYDDMKHNLSGYESGSTSDERDDEFMQECMKAGFFPEEPHFASPAQDVHKVAERSDEDFGNDDGENTSSDEGGSDSDGPEEPAPVEEPYDTVAETTDDEACPNPEDCEGLSGSEYYTSAESDNEDVDKPVSVEEPYDMVAETTDDESSL